MLRLRDETDRVSLQPLSEGGVPAGSGGLFSRIQKDFECGDLPAAADAISEWLAAAPGDAEALTANGHLLRLTGCFQQARAAFEQALTAAPGFAPALVETARLASQTGMLEDAHAWYDRAQRAVPDSTAWFGEWCDVLHGMGRADLGLPVAQRWCERCPDSPAAWFRLGLFRQTASLYEASLEAYERVLALDPGYPMLRNNLSALHYRRRDYGAALRFGMDAVHAGPNNHLAWTNVSNVWLMLREPAKAVLAARRACTLAPDYVLALLALSNALKETQCWDEAYGTIVRAAGAPGGDVKIQWSVAMLQLVRGDFRNGWINFEARWSGSPELDQSPAFHPERRWRDEDLSGRTLLVWGEQGFGDVFQFIRFVPLLADRVRAAGGQMTLCCFAEVFSLLRRSLTDVGVTVVPHDRAQSLVFDYHLPLASLPLALGTTLENLPAPPSYLRPEVARVADWRAQLANSGRLRVGLVWSGSRTHQRNPLRAVPPELYAQTFRTLSGVDFYSLQTGGADDVASIASAGLNVIDRTEALRSFDDTAAFIVNLDLVVTVCTSVAHLAGALGKRTWLLLDVNPHWTWMLERHDSPWYPSIVLYRQHRYGDWSEPLRQVGSDLAGLVSRQGE